MTTPTDIPVTNETDDFADAFAALQEPAAAVTPAADPLVIDVDAKVVPDPVAIAAPAVPDAPVVAGAVVPDPVVPAADPVVVPVVAAPDPVAERIAALEAQIAALKPTEPAAPVAAPVVAAPVYTKDEQAQVDKYAADWPDIRAGEALVRKAEYRDLVTYIFDQVHQRIAPLESVTQTQAGRSQYTDIVGLVPDYDVVRDKTLAWVDTQPEYLKKAYQEVANTGSAADVADLINRFKKETGYAQPAAVATPPAAAPVAATNAALPVAAAAAVQALRVVKSSRSEPVQGVDVNDFDSAFAEFSKAK